jgi:orotate phosphoribosyltransferase
MNKDALYPHTSLISRLCEEMAMRFSSEAVDVVLAPALGGIILSQWVAHHLSRQTGREVLAVYAEKVEGGDGFVIKRGYDKLLNGRKVLVLEDVLTTGGSVKKVVAVAGGHGARIAGVAALCNRGGIAKEELGAVPRLESLVEVNLDSWEEGECPLCKKGTAVNTEVGKGREFLAKTRAS